MQSTDVRTFIMEHVTPYHGDALFLAPITEGTRAIFQRAEALMNEERARGGVYDIDTENVSSLLTYAPGYIYKEKEHIVGLQTDEPLKRGVNPFGGLRMAKQACEAYGYELSEKIEAQFAYKTTHNEGVFRGYTDTMKKLRSSGLITGLPDAYGRGRIIGDYRRVALYGVDALILSKTKDKSVLESEPMTEENIRLSEELSKQLDFLDKLVQMAKSYGDDVRRPAQNAREAIQWTYYGYLAAIKEQNGAAMSLGRVSTFFDIYIEEDLKNNRLTEFEAQALIDEFVIKLRLARQLRTPEYNRLFGGDPLWITEAIGGMAEDGRTLVTKTSYRFLHTLTNLGSAPEPNMTVLWSSDLPEPFKQYCAKMSIETDAIQYENDDLMRPIYGDDYAIACCVSAMRLGKEMQFFGARCNLPKTLLLALNGGFDTTSNLQIGPLELVLSSPVLNWDSVKDRFERYIQWLCKEYVNTMNVIHYMHDKYAYEKIQMALHDTSVHRYMAFGIAGLSVIADSLSAIKHAKVIPIVDQHGYIVDFETTGDFPKFGNDDDAVDHIAQWIVETFYSALIAHKTYRNSEHTLSVLTITSNVVYGDKTGNTPDGRRSGAPFSPGANPMHGREHHGAISSLNSVSKIPYKVCKDGISCTFSITPKTLGSTSKDQMLNLVDLMDGYFLKGAQHLNVNVISKDKLMEAMRFPQHYPNLTVRVSGYAVDFHRLSREQQEEVLMRTYHERV